MSRLVKRCARRSQMRPSSHTREGRPSLLCVRTPLAASAVPSKCSWCSCRAFRLTYPRNATRAEGACAAAWTVSANSVRVSAAEPPAGRRSDVPSCYVMALGVPDSYSERPHPQGAQAYGRQMSGRVVSLLLRTHTSPLILAPKHSQCDCPVIVMHDNWRESGIAALLDPEGFHITYPRFPTCRSESGAKRLKRAKACVRTRRAHR
jgi:hypothetical protein